MFSNIHKTSPNPQKLTKEENIINTINSPLNTLYNGVCVYLCTCIYIFTHFPKPVFRFTSEICLIGRLIGVVLFGVRDVGGEGINDGIILLINNQQKGSLEFRISKHTVACDTSKFQISKSTVACDTSKVR